MSGGSDGLRGAGCEGCDGWVDGVAIRGPFLGHTGCDERPYRVGMNRVVHAVWSANMVCIGVDKD